MNKKHQVFLLGVLVNDIYWLLVILSAVTPWYLRSSTLIKLSPGYFVVEELSVAVTSMVVLVGTFCKYSR